MPTVVALIVLGIFVLVLVVYLLTIARSRSGMDSLHQPPDDMRRADDNQRPPDDGSAGLV